MTTFKILRMPLILAVFTALPVSTNAQEALPGDAVALTPEPAPELKALADTCSARKFETLLIADDGRRGSTVRICGEPGQSDASWLNTLRSSVKQAETNAALSSSARGQIVAALNEEIARLERLAAITSGPATIELSKELVAAREPAPEYSSLPPLPTPKRTTVRSASRAGAGAMVEAAAPEPVIPPKLTIRCGLPREDFTPCASLRRDTQILVRADEDLSDATSLRFLRGGDNRAELELSSLRKGASLREKLPARVCSGVLRGKVEVQVVKKNRVTGTLGPYKLYCGS